MTPKKECLFNAILSLLATIILIFNIDALKPIDILYVLPLIIMYLIMYKISDKIDIRYAHIIVNIVIY